MIHRFLPGLALLAGCSTSSSSGPAPVAPAAQASAFDPAAQLPTTSEDVTFMNGDVPGTLVHPTAPGKYPGIILMAGSGPTDRDWNSPLIPAKNGSAKLLAEALAAHGAVVLRFDKAGVGGNKHKLTDGATFDIYREEGRGALAFLRARPDVDAAHLFVAGHSEGAYHAARVAEAEGHAIAGVLLLSGAGRSLETILLAQIDGQMRQAMPAQVDAEMAALHHAFDDFAAGKPVDPDQVTSIPGLRMVLKSAMAPQSATLARGLLRFDPLPVVAKLDVPVFVYNGEKDIQVDPAIDAKALVEARKSAGKDVTEFLAPDANHVMEHETRAKAELAPTDVKYNEPDRVLDPASVDAIVKWIGEHAR
jgi:pimeloyl-ACP methyl ester carboxylesterase